jgi:hypothetical protein
MTQPVQDILSHSQGFDHDCPLTGQLVSTLMISGRMVVAFG